MISKALTLGYEEPGRILGGFTPGLFGLGLRSGPQDTGPLEVGTAFPTLLSGQPMAAMNCHSREKKHCHQVTPNAFYSLKIKLTKLKTPNNAPFLLALLKGIISFCLPTKVQCSSSVLV